MATAILRPHDCSKLRLHQETQPLPPLKPRRNPNPGSGRRKRSFVGFKDNVRDRVRDRSMVVKFPSKNLVMEQVTILKRGEELKPGEDGRSAVAGNNRTVRFENDEDLVLCTTDRLGPAPETVQKQIKISDSIYAGSALFSSPPPSSLPFPAFFAKKETNDAATTDLRRLLRLDLM